MKVESAVKEQRILMDQTLLHKHETQKLLNKFNKDQEEHNKIQINNIKNISDNIVKINANITHNNEEEKNREPKLLILEHQINGKLL